MHIGSDLKWTEMLLKAAMDFIICKWGFAPNISTLLPQICPQIYRDQKILSVMDGLDACMEANLFLSRVLAENESQSQ